MHTLFFPAQPPDYYYSTVSRFCSSTLPPTFCAMASLSLTMPLTKLKSPSRPYMAWLCGPAGSETAARTVGWS